MIHGFSGTPAEMLPLGEHLAKQGMTVLGVRLAGHGIRPSLLKGISYHHWVNSAVDGLTVLEATCQKIFIIGFSMGGTIALHLAATKRVDGVVSICTPVYLDLMLYIRRPLKYLLGFKNQVEQNIKDPEARKNHVAYTAAPPGAVLQLLALLRTVRSELGQITSPVLLFQSVDDRIVPSENAPYIFQRLTGVPHKKLIWLENSGHMATIDYDKAIIFREVRGYIDYLS